MEFMDKFTGEIVQSDYASNRLIPLPDFSVNNDPSETVPDQVEPVEITVRRCMRGEVMSIGNKTPQYEFDDKVNIDDIDFNDMESPGADLADIPSLVSRATPVATDVAVGNVAEPTKSEIKDNSSSETKSKGDSDLKSE